MFKFVESKPAQGNGDLEDGNFYAETHCHRAMSCKLLTFALIYEDKKHP